MFKDLNNGDQLYIIEVDPTTGIPKYEAATIALVSDDLQNLFDGKKLQFTVDTSTGSKEFSGIRAEDDFCMSGKYRITASKERAYKEVRRMYDENMDKVNSVDKYKAIAEKCSEVISLIGYSDKAMETDSRIVNLEKNMSKLISMMEAQMSK